MQRTRAVHIEELRAPFWCALHARLVPMTERRMLDDLADRLNEAMRASPAQDLEKNVRALLAAFFDRFDVVLREDFEVQRKLLERSQAKLAALEARVSELERTRR